MLRIFIAILILPIALFCQPAPGSVKLDISPRTPAVGDTVTVSAGVFSASLCPVVASYKLLGSAGTYDVLIMAEMAPGPCGLAYGFTGPSVRIPVEAAGHYAIHFHPESPFRLALGDSAYFDAGVTALAKAQRPPVALKAPTGAWKANGQAAPRSRPRSPLIRR